jgi:hypothetical protein
MDKKQMRKMFLEIIDNQIRDNNPPETKQTLDRLISDNYSEEEAKNMIGCVVISEIFDILESMKEFDEIRYIKGECEINCVNGHRYVNLLIERDLLWPNRHQKKNVNRNLLTN